MRNQELYRYIKKKLKDGFSEEDIRASLEGGGWDPNEINIGIFKAKEDAASEKGLDKPIKKHGKFFDFLVLFSIITALFLYMYAEGMLPSEVYDWSRELMFLLNKYYR